MSKHLNVNEAAANDSRAMETRDHFKNGASPKSLTSRRNFKLFKYALLLIASLMICSISCKKDKDKPEPKEPDNPTGGTETGKYMGIIAFNDDLYEKDINVLSNGTSNSFKSFIDGMKLADNTALYHAVWTAMDNLEKATLPSDLINVSIVTFTDGLDNISHRLNPSFPGEGQYQNAVSDRIKKLKIQGRPISAYAIGLLGKTGGGGESVMKASLNSVASNSNNVKMSDDMDVINEEFERIANSLYIENKSQTIDIKFPPPFFGSKVRFTFDDVDKNTMESSTLYIEGIYSDGDVLSNITYKGLKSSSGTKVQGVKDANSNSFILSFKDFALESGDDVSLNFLTMWRRSASATEWIEEDEFDRGAATLTEVEEKSTVIILVLDCSNSLGASDFAKLKNSAKNFIDVLLGNTAPRIYVTGVTLNKNTLELIEGGTEKLVATVQPSNATNKNVTWTSSKPEVATVVDGNVTAVTKGTTTITVATKDGNKTATCAVTVKAIDLPILSTIDATNITANSATLGGNITDSGTPVYTEKGICYATSQEPTTNNNKKVVSGGEITGNYTTNVTDLSPNTTYYVRAYAINSAGTAYGNQVSFKTESATEKSYILDDGSAEAAWRINPGYDASFGNRFVVGEAGQLTSVDVYGRSADDAGSRTVTIDIYNSSRVKVGSSSSFILPNGTWRTVSLNNISYSGTFYVMVRWSATSGETNYLGIDLDGSNATNRLGYYLSDGDWNVFEDIWDYGSDQYYKARGVFLIRAHAKSSGKTIKYEPDMPDSTPTPKTKSAAATQCQSSK